MPLASQPPWRTIYIYDVVLWQVNRLAAPTLSEVPSKSLLLSAIDWSLQLAKASLTYFVTKDEAESRFLARSGSIQLDGVPLLSFELLSVIKVDIHRWDIGKKVHRIRISWVNSRWSQSVEQIVRQILSTSGSDFNTGLTSLFSFQFIIRFPSCRSQIADVQVDNADSPDLPTARKVITTARRRFIASALPVSIKDSLIDKVNCDLSLESSLLWDPH